MDGKFHDEIKEAAREGALEGTRGHKPRRGFFGTVFGKIVLIIFLIAIIVLTVFITKSCVQGKNSTVSSVNNAILEKDNELVLEENGASGHTVVDFSSAILGEKSKLCKLEVLEQQVTDAATITETGLLNWDIFTKSQVITYHGTAVYTVDLSELNEADFELDEDKKELTIYIPHAECEPINIQSDEIEFGDVSKGFLAFGDIKATPDQIAAAQTEAQEMMEEKLEEQNIIEDADRFAKLVVWELFQPVINGVENGYSLIVEFED